MQQAFPPILCAQCRCPVPAPALAQHLSFLARSQLRRSLCGWVSCGVRAARPYRTTDTISSFRNKLRQLVGVDWTATNGAVFRQFAPVNLHLSRDGGSLASHSFFVLAHRFAPSYPSSPKPATAERTHKHPLCHSLLPALYLVPHTKGFAFTSHLSQTHHTPRLYQLTCRSRPSARNVISNRLTASCQSALPAIHHRAFRIPTLDVALNVHCILSTTGQLTIHTNTYCDHP